MPKRPEDEGPPPADDDAVKDLEDPEPEPPEEDPEDAGA
jgi:hypothetical protein